MKFKKEALSNGETAYWMDDSDEKLKRQAEAFQKWVDSELSNIPPSLEDRVETIENGINEIYDMVNSIKEMLGICEDDN